jgi:hypothetical protein
LSARSSLECKKRINYHCFYQVPAPFKTNGITTSDISFHTPNECVGSVDILKGRIFFIGYSTTSQVILVFICSLTSMSINEFSLLSLSRGLASAQGIIYIFCWVGQLAMTTGGGGSAHHALDRPT